MAGKDESRKRVSAGITSAAGQSWLASPKATYASALLGVIGAVLVWMTAFSADPMAAEREKLARKNQATKEKIRENAVVFSALDESEQARIRRVTAHMSSKTGTDWNVANRGVETFQDWFDSLSVSDREAIRGANDVDARKSKVLEFLKASEAIANNVGGPFRGRLDLRIPSGRFHQLAAVLEQAAGIEVDESRAPVLRVTEVIASEIGAGNERSSNLAALGKFLEPVSEDIIELLERPLPESRFPGRSSMAPVGIVFFSLEAEFQRLRRSQRITDEQVRDAFESRAADEDRLLNLSPSEFQSELTNYVVFEQIRDDQTTLSKEELEQLLTASGRLREALRASLGGRGGPPPGDPNFRPGGGRFRPDDRGFDGRGPGDRQPRGGFQGGERFGDRDGDRGGPRDRPPNPPNGRRPK